MDQNTTSITGTKNKDETFGLIAKAWEDADEKTFIKITQPNDRGGKTLEKTLKQYFPHAITDSRDKARIITIQKESATPDIIKTWLDHTRLRLIEETGFYTMPGLFGWNKIDKGSEILLQTIDAVKGVGADFGCGYGYLSKTILANHPEITQFYGFDIDPRAVEAATKNIDDPKATFQTIDCTKKIVSIGALDFIISNPPFHNETGEDRTLGQRFIQTASHHLKKNGALWIVANTHMPYEQILSKHFTSFDIILQKNGFKIIKALK